MDESTQDSPPGPHARHEASREPAKRKRVPAEFRWEAAYSDLLMWNAQNRLAGNEYAARASAEAIAAIDAKVLKAYRNHISPVSEPEPIEPEEAYRALRKKRDAAAKVVRSKNYRHEFSRDLGAIDRLTHNTSEERALRDSECASVTPVEASIGAPRTSREFYPGSHPPGSALIPRGVELPVFFDWIAARRDLNSRLEQYRQDGNRLAARVVDMAILAVDDRMRGIYDHYGAMRGAIQAETAYRELLRTHKDCRSGASLTHGKGPLGNRLASLHRLTYCKTVEFARMDRGFATLCMPAAPSGPSPVCDPAVLARWLWNKATPACENEAREREDGNHAAALAAWKEHIYFKRLCEELERGRDPWTASREFLKSLPKSSHGLPPPPQCTEAHGRLLRAMSDPTMHMEMQCPGEAVRPPVSAVLPTSPAAPPAGVPAGGSPGVSTASRPPPGARGDPPPGARGKVPPGFTWTTAYSRLKAHYLQCWARRDMHGIQKAGAAIEDTDARVIDACLCICPNLRASEVLGPVWAYNAIEQYRLQFESLTPGSRRLRKIDRAIKSIDQALAGKLTDLDLRGV